VFSVIVDPTNPTVQGSLDPNDDYAAFHILCDGAQDFGCAALLPGGPFTDLVTALNAGTAHDWLLSDDGEVHTCPACTARYAARWSARV